jgi:hypothetical protein
MTTLSSLVTTEYEIVACGECGIFFGMPIALYRERRNDHQSWYCPNGHCRAYKGKSELEVAREELARQKQLREQADAAAAQARDERDAAERKAKRLRHRVSGGTCPCCKRSFVALARHLATKHPGFVKEAKP